MSVDLFETFYTLIGAWKDAGHPKLSAKVRREMRPVVAKIAWHSALDAANRSVPDEPKSDRRWRVTVAAANATFLAEGDPIPVTYLPDYPAPYDHTHASLRRKAEQALEDRKRDLSRSRRAAEDLYERWMKWTGEVDSDLTKRQVEGDHYIERRHREAEQRAEERRSAQYQQIASRRKADAELQRLRDETQTRREAFERGLDSEAKARRNARAPRGETKDDRPLNDTEGRDLRKAFVWAMDVEVDGGTVPPDIEPLFYADRWERLTNAEARQILRWFYSTAPGDY